MRCPKCNGLLTCTPEEEYCVNCGNRTRFFTPIDSGVNDRVGYRSRVPSHICDCGNDKESNKDSCMTCMEIDLSVSISSTYSSRCQCGRPKENYRNLCKMCKEKGFKKSRQWDF